MKRKVIALLTVLCMMVTMIPAVSMAEGLVTVYDINASCYTTEGKWLESSLAGYNDGKTNYNVGGGSCTWQPELLFGGKYQLAIWNVQNAASVDTVTVEISDKNGVTTVTYKQRTGENGFVDLGQYEFDAGSAGYVKVIIDGEAVGSQFTRQSAVRYELVERGEGYQSLVPATGTETYEDYAMRSIPQKDVSIPETRDNAVKIYVQNGASGDGSEANPFGTIAEAQAKVRELIAGGYPEGGIGVYLKGGTYALDDTFTFTAEDSGTQDNPVIWQAVPGETVSFTGGKVIDHSNIKLVDDQETLDRLPSAGKGKVYETDLSLSGIENVPKMDLINSVPYVFTVGEKAGFLSRWPNEGYGRTGNLVDSSSRNDSGPRKKGFTYEISDPEPLRWTKATDVWLNGYWMTPYTIDYAQVANLDVDNMKISGKEFNYLGAYGNARYFALNILEEIDQEGEWYLDTDANKLYFYPYEGFENQQLTFSPKNFDIVRFDDASNIVLRDIRLEVAGGNGVTFSSDSSNCAMIGGEIINVSGVGASINGKNNYVRDCEISYTGAQGISMTGGDEYHLVPGNNYVENNEIHDVGTGGGNKQGITMYGCGNRASHNHVYNILTHGINGGGMEQIVEYNIVERTNLEMGDTGGIYFRNLGMGQGTKIRYNIVRDNVGIMAQTMTDEGALGIYLDDLTSGVEVYGNLVINAKEPGIVSHGGRENHFYNNIFINCDEPIRMSKTGIANTIQLPDGGAATNIRKYPYNEEPFLSKYPWLANVFEDDFGEPKNNVARNNVAFDSGSYNLSAIHNWNGVDENNINIEGQPNTNFTDFLDFDYSAIKAQIPDFEELPFDQMGTYTGGARTNTESIVFDNRAEAFQLTYPSNGATNVDPTTTLKWQLGKGGIRGYTIYLATDEKFEQIVEISNTTEGTFDVNLEYGTTYYWRVKADPMQDYPERWNANGVWSFTTMQADDKLTAEIRSAQFVLESTEEGTAAGQFPAGSKAVLEAEVSKAEGILSGGDDAAKKQEIRDLTDAKETYLAQIVPDTENLSTFIFDNYSGDTLEERPLGLFMRSYSPLNITVQPDPVNSNNQVVAFQDEHPQYHYAMRYFTSQNGYVEAGTSFMAAQNTGAFSFSLMKTGVYPVESGVGGNCAAKVVVSTDGVMYGDRDKTVPLTTIEPYQWYDIKIVLRLYEKQYDVFVNGAKLGENIPLCDSSVTEVNQIVYDTSDGSAVTSATMGTYYIDNTMVKAPTTPGRNQYLISLKVNGELVDGFEPAKTLYQTDLTAEELKNAQMEYETGKNAKVKVWNEEGVQYITVISADFANTYTYIVKAK